MKVHIASCVGGGPMERLARRLNGRGHDAKVVAEYTGEAWRQTMADGRTGRLRGRLGAFIQFPLRLVGDALSARPEVVVPTTNPFTLPLIAVATRALHRQKVAPLVYDLWPDALEASGMSVEGGLLSRLGQAANRWWFRRADGIVFIGERMARHAIARYGEPRSWTVIETGADVAELSADRLGPAEPQSELERLIEGRVVVSYVGNMGRMHDWETLAAAVPKLLEDPALAVPAMNGRLAIVIAASGPGAEHLRKAWADLPDDVVHFTEPLDDRAWARLLVRTDISLVTLRPEASRTCIPSKAFSALAARSALMVVAPEDSDLAELVSRHACGRHVEPGDAPALASALSELIGDDTAREATQDRALAAALAHYDMAALAERWEAFLTELPQR